MQVCRRICKCECVRELSYILVCVMNCVISHELYHLIIQCTLWIMVHTSICRDLHNFSRTLSPHYTIYSCRLSYTLVCVTTFIISRTSSRTSLTNCISHEHHKDQLPQTSPRTLSSLTNYIIISQRLHPELDLSRTSSWSSLTNSITSHRLHHHISGTSSRISLTNCISHEHHHNHFSRPLSSLTNCVMNFSISHELYQCISV